MRGRLFALHNLQPVPCSEMVRNEVDDGEERARAVGDSRVGNGRWVAIAEGQNVVRRQHGRSVQRGRIAGLPS